MLKRSLWNSTRAGERNSRIVRRLCAKQTGDRVGDCLLSAVADLQRAMSGDLRPPRSAGHAEAPGSSLLFPSSAAGAGAPESGFGDHGGKSAGAPASPTKQLTGTACGTRHSAPTAATTSPAPKTMDAMGKIAAMKLAAARWLPRRRRNSTSSPGRTLLRVSVQRTDWPGPLPLLNPANRITTAADAVAAATPEMTFKLDDAVTIENVPRNLLAAKRCIHKRTYQPTGPAPLNYYVEGMHVFFDRHGLDPSLSTVKRYVAVRTDEEWLACFKEWATGSDRRWSERVAMQIADARADLEQNVDPQRQRSAMAVVMELLAWPNLHARVISGLGPAVCKTISSGLDATVRCLAAEAVWILLVTPASRRLLLRSEDVAGWLAAGAAHIGSEIDTLTEQQSHERRRVESAVNLGVPVAASSLIPVADSGPDGRSAASRAAQRSSSTRTPVSHHAGDTGNLDAAIVKRRRALYEAQHLVMQLGLWAANVAGAVNCFALCGETVPDTLIAVSAAFVSLCGELSDACSRLVTAAVSDVSEVIAQQNAEAERDPADSGAPAAKPIAQRAETSGFDPSRNFVTHFVTARRRMTCALHVLVAPSTLGPGRARSLVSRIPDADGEAMRFVAALCTEEEDRNVQLAGAHILARMALCPRMQGLLRDDAAVSILLAALVNSSSSKRPADESVWHRGVYAPLPGVSSACQCYVVALWAATQGLIDHRRSAPHSSARASSQQGSTRPHWRISIARALPLASAIAFAPKESFASSAFGVLAGIFYAFSSYCEPDGRGEGVDERLLLRAVDAACAALTRWSSPRLWETALATLSASLGCNSSLVADHLHEKRGFCDVLVGVATDLLDGYAEAPSGGDRSSTSDGVPYVVLARGIRNAACVASYVAYLKPSSTLNSVAAMAARLLAFEADGDTLPFAATLVFASARHVHNRDVLCQHGVVNTLRARIERLMDLASTLERRGRIADGPSAPELSRASGDGSKGAFCADYSSVSWSTAVMPLHRVIELCLGALWAVTSPGWFGSSNGIVSARTANLAPLLGHIIGRSESHLVAAQTLSIEVLFALCANEAGTAETSAGNSACNALLRSNGIPSLLRLAQSWRCPTDQRLGAAQTLYHLRPVNSAAGLRDDVRSAWGTQSFEGLLVGYLHFRQPTKLQSFAVRMLAQSCSSELPRQRVVEMRGIESLAVLLEHTIESRFHTVHLACVGVADDSEEGDSEEGDGSRTLGEAAAAEENVLGDGAVIWILRCLLALSTVEDCQPAIGRYSLDLLLAVANIRDKFPRVAQETAARILSNIARHSQNRTRFYKAELRSSYPAKSTTQLVKTEDNETRMEFRTWWEEMYSRASDLRLRLATYRGNSDVPGGTKLPKHKCRSAHSAVEEVLHGTPPPAAVKRKPKADELAAARKAIRDESATRLVAAVGPDRQYPLVSAMKRLRQALTHGDTPQGVSSSIDSAPVVEESAAPREADPDTARFNGLLRHGRRRVPPAWMATALSAMTERRQSSEAYSSGKHRLTQSLSCLWAVDASSEDDAGDDGGSPAATEGKERPSSALSTGSARKPPNLARSAHLREVEEAAARGEPTVILPAAKTPRRRSRRRPSSAMTRTRRPISAFGRTTRHDHRTSSAQNRRKRPVSASSSRSKAGRLRPRQSLNSATLRSSTTEKRGAITPRRNTLESPAAGSSKFSSKDASLNPGERPRHPGVGGVSDQLDVAAEADPTASRWSAPVASASAVERECLVEQTGERGEAALTTQTRPVSTISMWPDSARHKFVLNRPDQQFVAIPDHTPFEWEKVSEAFACKHGVHRRPVSRISMPRGAQDRAMTQHEIEHFTRPQAKPDLDDVPGAKGLLNLPGASNPKLYTFQHVHGARVCEHMYEHVRMPDGTLTHVWYSEPVWEARTRQPMLIRAEPGSLKDIKQSSLASHPLPPIVEDIDIGKASHTPTGKELPRRVQHNSLFGGGRPPQRPPDEPAPFIVVEAEPKSAHEFEGEKFNLEDSIFAPRMTEAPAKSFFDTKRLLARMFRVDWSRVTAKSGFMRTLGKACAPSDDEGSSELQRIRKLLLKHYRMIAEMFDWSLAHNTVAGEYALGINALTEWSEACNIPDPNSDEFSRCRRSDIDTIFVAAK